MFLQHIKFSSLLICCLLSISGCSSLSSIGNTKKDDWKNAPKPYIDGLSAARKGNSKQAIKLFKQTIESYPKYVAAYTNLGLQQLRIKNLDNAKESLEKAIVLNPNNPAAYNHLGVIARINGDFDKALEMYQKSLELDEDYALAHFNIGILQDLYLYDLPQALQHYEQYQSLAKKKDKNVAKWIIDIKRRIAKNKKS